MGSIFSSRDRLLPNKITSRKFKEQLELYPDHVRDVYQDVEVQRFIRLPEELMHREQPSLTKQEVLNLELWMQ
jgi:hypothetical protein